MGSILDNINCTVIEDMNIMLNAAYTWGEIAMALKQMDPLKALGPNGLPPIFFQHYWGVTGNDVMKTVISCLTTSNIPVGINQIYISLIPKVKCPTRVSEFWPISLCNIIYKLVSKVLANRLKIFFPPLFLNLKVPSNQIRLFLIISLSH